VPVPCLTAIPPGAILDSADHEARVVESDWDAGRGGYAVKRFRMSSPALLPFVAVTCSTLLAWPAAAQVGNASITRIPTLDGVGLASLAGILTMSGAWLVARRNSRKR